MKKTTKKTTKLTTSVSWSAQLKDDNGAQFASMTGLIDNAHPLGTTSLVVSNSALYAANEEAAKAAYAAFQEEVAAVAETIAPVVTTEEVEE